MSPIAAMNVLAVITLTPGTVISRSVSGLRSACTAIARSTTATSASRKSTWRRQALTVSRSSSGSSSSANQRAPVTPKMSLTGGCPFKPADQHGVDLVLGAGARTHQLAALRQPAAHRPGVLVGNPHRVQLTGGQQPGQGPRVEAIGLGPRAADGRVVRTDHDHGGDVRADDPRDLGRVAGRLQRDPVRRGQAPREQLKSRRRRQHPPAGEPARSLIATSQKSRCTSIPTALNTPILLTSMDTTREQVGNTTQTDPRSQRNRASRRGGQ